MPVLIGTSGWQYRDWRERFYPRGLAQRSWLEHYAVGFDTVESNNAFYRLPERATFESWAQRTPPHFVWAVKMSRYLTHIKRLAEPAEPVQRFLERAAGLGPKLGPVLLQLPGFRTRQGGCWSSEGRRCASQTGARSRSRRCGARPIGATFAGTRDGPNPSPATALEPCAHGRDA
jgi:hypothetical protein